MSAPDPAHAARLAALAAVDADDGLRDAYALKGGLVLQHVFGSPRPSDDLDFNLVAPCVNEVSEETRGDLRAFVARLRRGLRATAPRFGLRRAGARITKWSGLLPTVFGEVWYESDAGAGRVEAQLTLSEVICATVRARIGGVPVRVTTLDDLVADKLKALLQQVPRHQVRHADVYDLWFALERAPFVPDSAVVAACFRAKATPWASLRPLSAGAFRRDAVRTFAEAGYRKLRAEEPDLPFAPFDEVWGRILALVDTLGLPDLR